MQKPLNRFAEFVSWFLEQYKDLLESSVRNYSLRIVAEKPVPKKHDVLFTIQFIGKSICPQMLATEIASDDELIAAFCPADVKRIMQAALSKPNLQVVYSGESHSIISKDFASEDQSPEYTINYVDDCNELHRKRMDWKEIFNCKKLLYRFSKKDIEDIAFTAGSESTLASFKEIELLNKQRG